MNVPVLSNSLSAQEQTKQKKMEYFRNTICVTFEELAGTKGEGSVLKKEHLNSLIRRGSVTRIRRGCYGTPSLISFRTLPGTYREKYIDKYGDPQKLLLNEYKTESLKMDKEARAFYEQYTYKNIAGNKVHLRPEKIDEYVLNASVINEINRQLNNRVALTKALNNCRRNLWPTIQGSLEKLREEYAHTLPSNLARLKDKIKEYKKNGYKTLVNGRMGNTNTLKITADAGRWIIAKKRSVVPVYTEQQIWTEFNQIALSHGWKKLKSKNSLHSFLFRPEIEPLWYDAAHGEMQSHQKYSRKNRTKLPGVRDALWYGDGTKLNLYYKEYTEAGKLVVKTTQVYEVVDAFSEVLLGYWISDHEDYEAQCNSYRMAIQKSGHKPYEIVYDNQGGHKRNESDGLFSRICNIHRPTAPYSGQSKTIENVFSRFQAQVLHKDWRFTGQNVTTKKENSKPNVEFISANKKNLYTLNELKAAYLMARREWNELKHPATGISRIDMYNSSVNAETEVVTAYDMIDMFWVRTQRASTFTASGIEVVIKGKKFAYEVFSRPGVPDHEWRRNNIGRRFFVMYDPYDQTQVRLYRKEPDGGMRFECTAEPYMVIHRAQQEQEKGEQTFIRRQVVANKLDRIERQVAARIIEQDHGVAPEQNGLNRQKMKNMPSWAEREIEQRVRRYRRDPEEVELGKVTKKISNLTFDVDDSKEDKFDLRKIAGKF